jgi:cryptochrome
VRRYVPELKDLDKKFICEPWKAPIADQKKAGVRIQGDGKEEIDGVYPKPMFNFGERRTICIDDMKKAYKIGLYGNDPKVIDGTWRELFDDNVEGPTEGKTFEDAMGNGAGNGAKVGEGPKGGSKEDGAVAEDESGAKETGGETKGRDKTGKKRKGGQGTLDAHVKRFEDVEVMAGDAPCEIYQICKVI